MSLKQYFTSESVTEGHPDKVCDYISDSVLDAYLAQDICSRVACEAMAKNDKVILAGEITSGGTVNLESVVRQAVRDIGYTDDSEPFSADTLQVIAYLTEQAREINTAVGQTGAACPDLGAGDQGIMFGYATDETRELMPLPILLAHRLAFGLADDRKSGRCPWLRPDGKTQVTVLYDNGRPVEVSHIIIAAQHEKGIPLEKIQDYARRTLVPQSLGSWYHPDIQLIVNSSGSFVQGGPSADCGLTGRKNIVDAYGGAVPHGGGALSGKDPSKVDRSAAYFCRYVARQAVLAGIAKKIEIQAAYAIGRAEPLAIGLKCFGTGDEKAAYDFVRGYSFRPAAIIEQLDLYRPIYRKTTNYGHFGRPGLPWEK
jgi:S-adenosylmethionine synthetase